MSAVPVKVFYSLVPGRRVERSERRCVGKELVMMIAWQFFQGAFTVTVQYVGFKLMKQRFPTMIRSQLRVIDLKNFVNAVAHKI